MQTLKEGYYTISDGFVVKRNGNVLTVYKTVRKRFVDGQYRCRDCAHNKQGYTTSVRWYMSDICECKPKRIDKDGKQLYYTVSKYGKPCEDFKLRDDG